MKARRLQWDGMRKTSSAKEFLYGNPLQKWLIGRPMRRWEDNIEMDLREIDCEVNVPGSETCTIADNGPNSVYSSGSATIELVE